MTSLKEKLKQEKGITLIAIVVTIVVLVILAGVSISLVLGQYGIIGRAQVAGETQKNAQNLEEAYLQNADLYIEEQIEGISGGNSPVVHETLLSQISGENGDYGKPINYSVTVGTGNSAVTLNDWKVFLNDGNNVYIILSDYLPIGAVPEACGFSTSGSYSVTAQSSWSNSDFVSKLTNTNNWATIASGIEGATATGSPTYEQFATSYNENTNTGKLSLTPSSKVLTDSTQLYVRPQNSNCVGFWLAAKDSADNGSVWRVRYDGISSSTASNSNNSYSLRPLIKLPAGLTGTVEQTSVKID